MRSDFHSCLRDTNNTVSCYPVTRDVHVIAAVQKSLKALHSPYIESKCFAIKL